jgi:hypothetical protein
MTLLPTCPRVAPCSPPSSTLRVGSADGLRPCLTAPARDALELSGRDEEKARVSRTKKHGWRRAKTNDWGVSSSCRQGVNSGWRWTPSHGPGMADGALGSHRPVAPGQRGGETHDRPAIAGWPHGHRLRLLHPWRDAARRDHRDYGPLAGAAEATSSRRMRRLIM